MRNNILAAFFCSFFLIGAVYAYTAPTYATQQSQAGGMCGSFGWDLEACDCFGATAACSTDPDNGCKPKQGIFNIAYVPAGRCRKHTPGDCPPEAIIKRKVDEWTSRTEWMDWRSAAAVARFERLVSHAAQAGYQAIEPDDTTEYVTPEILKMLADIAQKYKMKMVVKNDIKGTWTDFIKQFPEYRKNIAMVLVESCTTYNECDKYIPFRDAGIPIVLTVRGFNGVMTDAIVQAAQNLHAAAALVQTREHVRTVTTIGKVCIDGAALVASKGPSNEQLQSLVRFPVSSPNPGGGAWTQQDFNRLQPTATPSYLNPNQSLGTGTSNPYAQQYWQASGTLTNTSATSGTPGLLSGSVVSSPSAVSSSGTQQTNEEEDGAMPTSTNTTSNTQTTSKLQARITCAPQALSRGGNVSIAWRCAPGCTSTGSSTSGSFTTGKARVGSKKVQVTQSSGFTVRCSCVDGMSAPTSCSVRVQAPQVRTTPPTPSPQQSTADAAPSAPQACFMGFCL